MLYTYISHSRVPKTYHGVTFYYGDKKEVTGTISDKRFVFCYSRPNPSTSDVTPTVEAKPTKPVVEPSKPVAEVKPTEDKVAEDKPTDKPKATRGRKPKSIKSIVEESNSADKE